MGARQSANRPIRSGTSVNSTFRLPVPGFGDKISGLDNSLIAFNNRPAFQSGFSVSRRVAVLLLRAASTRGRTGRPAEAPPWLSLFFSPFLPLTPSNPSSRAESFRTRAIKDGGNGGNMRCVTHSSPFPPRDSTLLYQIRGNRNFTIVGDTHLIDAMTRLEPSYTRARIGYTKERLDFGWKDTRLFIATLSAFRFGSIDESISRGDVRSFRPSSHHPRRVSLFLSPFLPFLPSFFPSLFSFFISSIRVVASIRSSSGVRLRHRYQFPLFI